MTRASLLIAIAVFTMTALVMADSSSAVIARYRASGDWTSITDGSSPGWGPNPNGVGTTLPGAGDDARVNFGNNTVTVTSVVPTVGRVQIGVDESGNVVVNSGGNLSTSGDFLAGNNNSNATGNLTVNNGGFVDVGGILWTANGGSRGNITINTGGQVEVGNHLWWGISSNVDSAPSVIDISGTLTQTGGILGLGTSNAAAPSGGTATVNILDGGLLSLNNIHGAGTSVQPGSVINISGSGELTVPGNRIGSLTNYVNDGKIVGIGGTLSIDLTKNPGFTTAYLAVIPEPSGFLCFGLLLVGGFTKRRR